MAAPYLPPEIISRIIHFAQPPHNFSSRLTRQRVFKQLGRVAFVWYGFSKEDADRWIPIKALIRRNHEPKVGVRGRQELKKLRRLVGLPKYLIPSDRRLGELRRKIQEGVSLQAEIFYILKRCHELEELHWDQYPAPTDGVRLSIFEYLEKKLGSGNRQRVGLESEVLPAPVINNGSFEYYLQNWHELWLRLTS